MTTGDSINFTIANSVRTVLGFNPGVITAPSANYSFFSDNAASFNRINNFIITSSLVNVGIQINSQSQGVIASIPISSAPGSQISYSPQNVVWFSSMELCGQPKVNIQFTLRDQNLRPVIAVDYYSFTICIRFTVLLSSEVLALKPYPDNC